MFTKLNIFDASNSSRLRLWKFRHLCSSLSADSIRHRTKTTSSNVMQPQFQNQSEFAGDLPAPKSSPDMDAERDTAPLYSSSSECHLTERQQEEMKFDMNHGGVGVCDALRRALSHCSPISRCALVSSLSVNYERSVIVIAGFKIAFPNLFSEAPCSSWWPSISVYHVPCECCNNELRDYTAEDRYGKGSLL